MVYKQGHYSTAARLAYSTAPDKTTVLLLATNSNHYDNNISFRTVDGFTGQTLLAVRAVVPPEGCDSERAGRRAGILKFYR